MVSFEDKRPPGALPSDPAFPDTHSSDGRSAESLHRLLDGVAQQLAELRQALLTAPHAVPPGVARQIGALTSVTTLVQADAPVPTLPDLTAPVSFPILTALLDVIDFPLIVADGDGRVRWVNQACVRGFGPGLKALEGHPLPQELVPGRAVERRLTDHDGQERITEWTLLLIPSPNPQLRLVSIRDVTERSRSTARLRQDRDQLAQDLADQVRALERTNAELQRLLEKQEATQEALRRSEARNRAMVKAIPDLLFTVSREGIFVDHETPTPESLLVPPDQFLGKRLSQVLPEDVAERALAAMETALRTGQLQRMEYAVPMPYPDGPLRFYEARIVPSGPDKVLILVRDIHERKELERQQERMLQGLRGILQAVDELVSLPSGPDFHRRVVELARERLGVERCSLFLAQDGELQGSFGTSLQGETTDERTFRQPIPSDIAAWLSQDVPGDAPHWLERQDLHTEWDGQRPMPIGKGWIVHTPIYSSKRLIGLFSNDAAISGAPMDPVQQELLSIYASLVGNLLERLEAEDALARSEEQYRILFETMVQGVTYQDATGRIVSANSAAARITGMSLDDLLRDPPPADHPVLVYPDGSPCPVEEYPFARALRTGKPVRQVILGMKRRDVLFRWLNVTSVPQFRAGEDRPYQVITTFEDITALVETRNALRESEKRYRELYQQAQRSLVRTEALYRASQSLIGANRLSDVLRSLADSAAQALDADRVLVVVRQGDREDQLKVVQDSRHPTAEVEHPLAAEALWQGVTGWVIRTGQPALSPKGAPDPREGEEVAQLRQQHTGGGAAAVAPIRFGDKVLGCLAAANRAENPDFTEDDLDLLMALANQAAMVIERARLQAESAERAAELARQTVRLARSHADLEQIARIVTRDLQSDLQEIHGLLAGLQEQLQDGEASGHFLLEQALERMAQARQRLQALQAYSQVDPQPRLQRVDASAILAQVLEEMAPQLEAASAQVHWERLPAVRAHGEQLALLFRHLLDNAVRFRGPKPLQVHITARHMDNVWLFSVQDNGLGIPAHQADRIFRVFHRLESRGGVPGAGVGLAICKKIVEGHGGQIWVESQEGQGATFYFTLPGTGAAGLL